MSPARILVIEDENKTAAFLSKGLREAGFAVDVARDGETGLEQARATKFDLLIVDIMLPHKDGWDVVADLRRDGVRTPILFLTARDSVRDRVRDSSSVQTIIWSNRSRFLNYWPASARCCGVLPSSSPNIYTSTIWNSTWSGTRQRAPAFR